MGKPKKQPSTVESLRVPPGPVDLASYDTGAKPGFAGGKKKGKAALFALGGELSDLQERLFAEGMSGAGRRILLVLQGMDTSGKGGIVRHSLALVDPQGVHTKAFKAPTRAERRHDFLWRVERALPAPGMIGVFDRSHYEDVLIARVRELAPRREIDRPLPRRSTPSRSGWSTRARWSSSACCTSPPRSRRSGCWPGSTTPTSSGSSTPATSTSGRSGRRTRRPTRSPLERTNTDARALARGAE